MKKPAVTQTLVKDDQLTLVLKTVKNDKIEEEHWIGWDETRKATQLKQEIQLEKINQ